MKRKIKKFTNLIEKVTKEVIAYTGSIVINVAFLEALKSILRSYIKNDKIISSIVYAMSFLAAPIFIKCVKQRLGYSEEECKNIYDVIKDVCNFNYNNISA
ncbi:MAG: hypothetical protein IJ094_13140 [Bacilli bacterium]|nr:hypothetical protein [Bacilli bacterium]